jgi:hypothetical protein
MKLNSLLHMVPALEDPREVVYDGGPVDYADTSDTLESA